MKYVLIFIYLAVNVLLFVLNWDLFTAVLDFDLGFGTFKALPLLILQIFGGVVLAIFVLMDGIKDLKQTVKISGLQKTILTLEKDAEIASLKKNNDARNLKENSEMENKNLSGNNLMKE